MTESIETAAVAEPNFAGYEPSLVHKPYPHKPAYATQADAKRGRVVRARVAQRPDLG